MRLFPDSLAGRTILVLLVGLTLSHVISTLAYHASLLHELTLTSERQLAIRLTAAKRTVENARPADRDRVANALSDAGLDVHWSADSLAPALEASQRDIKLRDVLRSLSPALASTGLRAVTADQAMLDGSIGRFLLVSIRLDDGTWLNASAPVHVPHPVGSWELTFSTSLMAAAIIVFAALSVRVVTAPLRTLSDAADRLGLDVEASRLPETGPREVRHSARAFNDMQERIRRLIGDRTQTLAAISHDLKTPLTRMMLRAEFVEDNELRQKMLVDLAEMEQMVDSALAFLRQEASSEEAQVVDVSTLLATICDDMADAGHDVQLEAGRQALLRCRPLALKRALVNLIDNAVRYGAHATVHLTNEAGQLRIEIEDCGPGIPVDERERVFSPFYRIGGLHGSVRGTGLGLTVARSTIRAHGGEIELRDRPQAGLCVVVRLPKLELISALDGADGLFQQIGVTATAAGRP